ncbi:MAG: hypothetical protein MUC50_23965, partial [Myxococcota bacterium]|nr:hypothetical protein [Myxococcota bacterium]
MQYHRHSSKLVLGLLLVVGCPGSDAGNETATDSEDTETTADTATSVDTDTFNSESDTFDIDATDTGTDEIAVPEDPAELGPCAFTQFKGSAKGTDSSHKIPVTVYLPVQCPAPFPVIVFSHGFQLDVGLYKSTAEHFASWGYIVALGEHREAMLPPTTDAMIVQDITDVAKWV